MSSVSVESHIGSRPWNSLISVESSVVSSILVVGVIFTLALENSVTPLGRIL
jgi:hypothetical protein